jgi:outer membrane protein TolC
MNQERLAAAEVIGALEAARLLTESAARLSQGGTQSFLTRADEGRRIALGAYREGAAPLLQVIDAARTWGDAHLAFYRTLYAQHQSVLTLLVAEGQDLFSSLHVPAAPAAPIR